MELKGEILVYNFNLSLVTCENYLPGLLGNFVFYDLA